MSSIGQGSETVFAQMCAEFFGSDYDRVRVHTGNTAASPLNTGSFATRTVIAAAGALLDACARLREKTLRIAAHMLGVADPRDLDIVRQTVQHRDDPTLMLPGCQKLQSPIRGLAARTHASSANTAPRHERRSPASAFRKDHMNDIASPPGDGDLITVHARTAPCCMGSAGIALSCSRTYR